MSHNQPVWKKYLLVLYVGMWCVILVGASIWLTTFLVGTLGDTQEPALELDMFDSVVALTEKKSRALSWRMGIPRAEAPRTLPPRRTMVSARQMELLR